MKAYPLGELCDITVGRTPARKAPELWGKGQPWVSIGDLNQGLVITSTKEQITDAGAAGGKLVSAGTVLLSFKLSIGKVARAGMPLYTNEAIAALPVRDPNWVDEGYLLRALQSMDLTGSSNRAAMGATLNKATLQQVMIPLPPIDEQRRIAAILDQADALRQDRVALVKDLQRLPQALFFQDFVCRADALPHQSLNELGEVKLGRQRAPKYQTGRWARPYMRVANVQREKIDVSDVLSMDFEEADFREYSLQPGDILLNEGQSTELVGRPAMWRNEIEGCCFQNTLLRFRADSRKVISEYALQQFIRWMDDGTFARLSSKTSNVAHLGRARFAALKMPVPPISRQTDFTEAVREIRGLLERATEALKDHDALFASLQSRAFKGEL